MALSTVLMACTVLLLVAPAAAQTSTGALPPSPSPSAAPAPAPHWVNLTELLTVAGPFSTFLRYAERTDAIATFQNQANDTHQGVTIFVPTDDAFATLKAPSLANLTQDQLRSLLLAHAFPKFYSLAEFRNLSQRNPVATSAGGGYTLNVSDASGLVRVDSGWANPRISSSVYATDPVAVYEVQRVLLPVAIFGAAPPPPPPAPAPAPEAAKPSDLAPAEAGGGGSSPKSDPSSPGSPAYHAGVGAANYLVLAIAGLLL
uniref:Fasciclin-like arabinogalactan protein 7 n=1 Tax=Anthurium amnicola TaxID=1678845 RepID=A0A1D1Y6H7_9ARAE